jgi:hypothetical protein
MTKVYSTSSLRIISFMSDSSELDKSSSKNRSLALMDKLIYKSTYQHRKGQKNSTKSMRIDPKYTHRCSAPVRSIPAATAAVSAG